MKTLHWPAAAVFLGSLAAFFSAQCVPATIRWHPIENGGPPRSIVLSPADPTITNVINFVAPTDGQIYANDCFASVSKGVPLIDVDLIFHKVSVSFSAPQTNRACPAIVFPVSGVEGEFGPLEPGAWTFNILGSSYPFTVTGVPMLLSVKALTYSPSVQISWPVSGEVFELESSESLPPVNWLVVTNAAVTSSNQVTVQIDSSSGTRFFRLRRLPLR